MFSWLFQLDQTTYPKALVELTPSSLHKGEPAWYEYHYSILKFRESYLSQIKRAAEKINQYREKYGKVSLATNVPWMLIGAIHSLESNCDFKACLHNGERIIGTGRKTRLVPRGRGPFATWEEAAIDALKLDGLSGKSDWSLGKMLQFAERYNGLGYLKHHPDQNSPYVWACSDQCKIFGKYTSDGSYSPTARADGQVGVAVMFKYLEENNLIPKFENVNILEPT